MIVYIYDENMIFHEAVIASENPLEEGKFLIPANSTKTKPPKIRNGYNIVFNPSGSKWEYIEIKKNKETLDLEINIEKEIKIKNTRMAQFRTQLYRLKLLSKADEFSKTNEEFVIYWEYESLLYKDSNFVIGLFDYLGFAEEDIDSFFIEANKIK